MLQKKDQINYIYIAGISFISALGGYLFGFDFAVIAGALPFLKEQFHFSDVQEGFATATLALGCIAGCLVAGSISNKYGRKRGLMLAALIFLTSSLAMAWAHNSTVFIAARFFAGIGVGMASVLSPMYIAEIAPAHVRGRMVTVNQLTIVTGILITNLVNYSLRNAGPDAWRWMVGLGAVPSALFIIGVVFLPESPRWLVSAGLSEKARKILQRIGGAEYATNHLAAIQQTLSGNTRINYGEVFRKDVRPAILAGIGLAVFQQFCGINVVFNYTTSIFQSIGFDQDDQLRQTVFIGIVNLAATLIAMWQVDKLGRKPLMLFGSLGLCVLYVISAVLLQQKSAAASWSLLAAIGTYAMTLAPVTWVLISEIFPNRVRSAATPVAVVALWLAYAILTFTFPILAKRTGTYTPFYIYAGICLTGFLWIKASLKETRGKSLEEMDGVFNPH